MKNALLDRQATRWMSYHLVTGNRVGAVTGNPSDSDSLDTLGTASSRRVLIGIFSVEQIHTIHSEGRQQ